MISQVKLKFGRGPGMPPAEIDATPVTVFVGPNHSGKSKVLGELQQFCTTADRLSSNVILDQAVMSGYSAEEAEGRLRAVTLKPLPTDTIGEGNVFVGRAGERHQVNREELLKALQQPTRDMHMFARLYLAYSTLMLDGKKRITLVASQKAGDLQTSPQTSFQVLFRDNTKRSEVRRIVHEAFDVHLVVDPTKLGDLRLRLSARPPNSEMEERGIHAEAVAFHAAALPIEQASDGVKAFTGMLCEITAGDPSVILIDEPEAFLHPSLSFKLGKEIARAGAGTGKRIFASTHSANFVMGCIQSGAPVNIVRLTYRGGVPTARILRNDDLLMLMRNPLLRSTGVLNGLFYEFVVVTESDADRAFYQEINERLLRENPSLGVVNCLFLNAQNKQTVQTILKPLRQLGIPAAAIVDVDVLKDGGSTWTNFLEAGSVPSVEHQAFGTIRATLRQKLDATGRDMKRDGGIDLLAGADKEAAKNLLDRLGEYGLFVVDRGELESWLKGLGATGHGPNWLIDIFQRMGEDPDAPGYVRASSGDVWGFIGKVKEWLMNGRRKGIPA